MAHLETQEIWDNDASGDATAHRVWTRKFLVLYDEVVASAEALDAPDIPTRWSPHPLDFRMLASDAKASKWKSDPLTHIVEVTYDSQTGAEDRGDDDPLARPATIETDFIAYQKPLVYDKDGNAVLNSAKDPFDPPAQIEDSRIILKFTRFEASLDVARSLAYRNAVNTDSFWGFSAGEVMCMYIKQTRHFENAIEYWQTSYEFHVKENGSLNSDGTDTPYLGWDIVIPDMGYNEVGANGKRYMIHEDNSTRPVSVPVRLNGAGLQLRPPNAPSSKTWFLIFRPNYRYLSFSALNLPEP